MKRLEYLQTVHSQRSQYLKRSKSINYLEIEHEPKSKTGIKKEEKALFRNEVKALLRSLNRRAHKGDIILQIDFSVTEKNAPSIQNLPKNYLDLLHKENNQDKMKNLLFKDDGQIKILIVNYNTNSEDLPEAFKIRRPSIRINSYPLSNFIKDIELTQRISRNIFHQVDSIRSLNFDSQIHDDQHDHFDHRRELENLENILRDTSGQLSETLNDFRKNYLTRNIQQDYLKKNAFKISDLVLIFQSRFSYNKKHELDEGFQKIWDITRNYIYLSFDFIELGNAPRKHGESSIFKSNLEVRLNDFKTKHSVLFPLLQPVKLLVTFIPPKNNVADLDNLARLIVPLVHKIFQPPLIPNIAIHKKVSNTKTDIGSQTKAVLTPESITGYQLIHIPRTEDDPIDGKIDIFFSDGFGETRSIWQMVDDVIYKWQKSFK